MRTKLDLSPKKRPSTARGDQTYRAVVAATARLLERDGYEAVTTNHVAERAGVGIASVYEFFPGKHALVAAVVEQMVESVIAELAVGLEQAFAHGDDPITEWIHAMFGAVTKHRRLFTVLVQEVPFLWQVPAVRSSRRRLYELALRARALRPGAMTSPHAEAMTHLVPIMVANAVVDSVIRPPRGIEPEALELAVVAAVKRLVE